MFKTESIGGVIAGMLFLILIYLLVVNWEGSVKIVGAIGSNTVDGVKALQGR